MELNVIRQADPQVADAIEAELNRQRSHIELIASENFVSPAVMAAMGFLYLRMTLTRLLVSPSPKAIGLGDRRNRRPADRVSRTWP